MAAKRPTKIKQNKSPHRGPCACWAAVESLCLKWYRSATGQKTGGNQAPCEGSFAGEGPWDGAVPEPRPFPSAGTAGNSPAVRVAGGILAVKCRRLKVTTATR